jgi:hypothetical protein
MDTTTCLDCATEIQQKTADRYFGRCKQCSARTNDESKNLTPSNQLLVRAAFSPGFAEDLTSWETFLHFDGQLLQAINWHTPGNPLRRRVHERLTIKVTTQQLDAATAALSKVGSLGLHQFKGHFWMDDAARMHLYSPKFRINATVQPCVKGLSTQPDGISPDVESSLSTFRNAWDVIESLSPYTTKMHRNKRRTRR